MRREIKGAESVKGEIRCMREKIKCEGKKSRITGRNNRHKS